MARNRQAAHRRPDALDRLDMELTAEGRRAIGATNRQARPRSGTLKNAKEFQALTTEMYPHERAKAAARLIEDCTQTINDLCESAESHIMLSGETEQILEMARQTRIGAKALLKEYETLARSNAAARANLTRQKIRRHNARTWAPLTEKQVDRQINAQKHGTPF